MINITTQAICDDCKTSIIILRENGEHGYTLRYKWRLYLRVNDWLVLETHEQGCDDKHYCPACKKARTDPSYDI